MHYVSATASTDVFHTPQPWMRHYLTVLMLLGSGETALQPGLRSFLEKRVSAALAGGSGGRRLERGQAVHPAAPGLVNGLVAASPSSGDACAAWVHRTAMQAVAALENEPSLGEATVAGSLGLLDLAGAQADRRAAALRMYNERLRGYAAAATQIGTRDWVRAGIDWSADAFYREGEGCRLTKREAVRESYRRSGGPPTDEVRAMLLRLAREGGGREAGEPIKLLDVGSCGTLFDERYEGVRATALDLCPQEGTQRRGAAGCLQEGNRAVLQCDFLQLRVSPAGSEPEVEPHDRFPAGALRSLAEGSFDAVVLSLVLSYLPLPHQRGEMVLKARQLLPSPDPPERAACVRCRREQEYLTQWAAAIEAAGFVFLRHVTLPRSHALAFATTSGGGGGGEEPPELHMKREQREQGWELSSADGGDGV
ncbi:hypothetical protein EMIHUDRAFT_227478 [Emiliania huxleyi CCMP1516]|uniref:Methyltransferase type 11 domain-containing protein n=2 Tax=Emiliania huxleyi TaxID=2903 RepID=A0A0D3KIU8_EMIH1|nr:hypothetical protein EMIHUDRAFT_227478 [Emiliania huxleyi CCMP1516]EOD35683.1 hypothetical protein EMIHUDRAFT_227478 [Emiliania huxleyi CCMP1516]|eukprot:XP_005788112.1 hypothetical protein EMIHUDRAFT_227478 [Emiliania huxleyi CCMP1516]